MRKVTERQAAAGQTSTRMKELIYLGGFEIFREYQNDGDTVKLERATLHIMDDQQRIALVETRIQGNDGSPAQLIRYQFGNHLGSVSLELDDQAQIISYEEYTPYGSTSYQARRSQIEVKRKQYRYTGMERDEESGLSYHSARYYLPWLGRWASADPEGLSGGDDLYRFVNCNPIFFTDGTGNSPKKNSSLPSNVARRYEVRQHKRFKKTNRVGGNKLESHHPIQDEWAKKNVAGYNSQEAPGHLLAVGKGEEHTSISNDQRKLDPRSGSIREWSDKSFSSARSEAVNQYEKAGLMTPEKKGFEALSRSDSYLFTLNDKFDKKSGTVMKNSNFKKNMNIAKAHGYAKKLASLGPLGTAVGVGTAVYLLAQGEPMAAVRELLGAVPGVGDFLDVVDIGYGVWEYFSEALATNDRNEKFRQAWQERRELFSVIDHYTVINGHEVSVYSHPELGILHFDMTGAGFVDDEGVSMHTISYFPALLDPYEQR